MERNGMISPIRPKKSFFGKVGAVMSNTIKAFGCSAVSAMAMIPIFAMADDDGGVSGLISSLGTLIPIFIGVVGGIVLMGGLIQYGKAQRNEGQGAEKASGWLAAGVIILIAAIASRVLLNFVTKSLTTINGLE